MPFGDQGMIGKARAERMRELVEQPLPPISGSFGGDERTFGNG
jgi:hypothetical protein